MDAKEIVKRFFADYPPEAAVLEGKGTQTILFLSGSLDLNYSRHLQDLLTWLVDNQSGGSEIVVDLEKVNYISSTGVGAISFAMIKARKRGLAFTIRNLQPEIRSIFELLGLMRFFDEAKSDD